MSEQRGPASWHQLRAGRGCGMCATQGTEDSGSGVRFLQGGYADVLTLGNALPHLHTHIVPRYADDPVPGHPLPFDLLDNDRQPEARLQADVLALRTVVDPLGL